VPYRQPLTPGPVGGGAGDDLPGREVLPPPAAYPGEDALASGLGPPGDDHADAALPPAVQPQLVVERLVEVLGPAADGLVAAVHAVRAQLPVRHSAHGPVGLPAAAAADDPRPPQGGHPVKCVLVFRVVLGPEADGEALARGRAGHLAGAGPAPQQPLP